MIQRNIELGYGTVTKEAMMDKKLSIEAKAIYAYLCSYCGGKDEAFPGISKICFDLSITDQRLRRHMKQLIDEEYIAVTQYRYTGSSKFAHNHYTILK